MGVMEKGAIVGGNYTSTTTWEIIWRFLNETATMMTAIISSYNMPGYIPEGTGKQIPV